MTIRPLTKPNCGKIVGTKYANGPAMLATSEAVAEEVSALMHDDYTNSPKQLIRIHPRRNFHRSIRATVWWFTNGRCWYCGKNTNPFVDFCIDHVVPLARGGSNDLENLVPCCSWCNTQKAALLVEEWRERFSDPHYYEPPFTDDGPEFAYEQKDKPLSFEFTKFMAICEHREEEAEA